MKTVKNKKAVYLDSYSNTTNFIISGKTYKRNELNRFFALPVLELADKETLIELWKLAIESQIKEYITRVDNVFNRKYREC